MRMLRWLAASLLGAGSFAAAWWIAQRQFGLDMQSAIGVATAAAAVVGLPASWWASQTRPARGRPQGRNVTARPAPAQGDVTALSLHGLPRGQITISHARGQADANGSEIDEHAGALPAVWNVVARNPAFVGRSGSL